MKVTVHIDTTTSQQVTIGLTIDEKKYQKTEELSLRKNQPVLPLLDALLREHHLTVQDITAITVNPGPGSFTGLRVGIAIANTLGYLLHVPINGEKVGTQIEAIYE